jgi:hypothetical protein
MNDGINDFVKAIGILGAMISVMVAIRTLQRYNLINDSEDLAKEQIRLLRNIDSRLERISKG